MKKHSIFFPLVFAFIGRCNIVSALNHFGAILTIYGSKEIFLRLDAIGKKQKQKKFQFAFGMLLPKTEYGNRHTSTTSIIINERRKKNTFLQENNRWILHEMHFPHFWFRKKFTYTHCLNNRKRWWKQDLN